MILQNDTMHFKVKLSILSFVSHFILTVFIFVLPSSMICLPIIVALAIYYLINNKHGYFLLLGAYTICLNSELVYYVFGIVLFVFLLLKKKDVQRTKSAEVITSYFRYIILYIFVIYFFQLIFEGSILSLPFFMITFFLPTLIMFYVWKSKISYSQLTFFFQHFLILAIMQAIIAFFFQALPRGLSNRLGDIIKGTTSDAPTLTMILIFASFPFVFELFKRPFITSNKRILIGILFLFLAVIYINDSKTQIGAFLIAAGGIVLSFKVFFNKNWFYKVSFILGGVLIILLSYTSVLKKVGDVIVDYNVYINGKYNAKVLYYTSTLSPSTRPIFQYITGTGAGTNGSRAGNALAYDVLFKKDVSLPSFIPAKSNEYTKKYLSTYYTIDDALSVHDRSAVLGNPFNSMCALFVELGVLGFSLFIFFLYRIYVLLMTSKYNQKFILIALVLLIANTVTAFVDQTFERVVPMYLMFLFIGLAFKQFDVVNNNTTDNSLIN